MPNPLPVVTMLLAGYFLAVGVQTLLAFFYTRIGRGTLIAPDDSWTTTYFGLTGLAWVITLGVTTFFTLPMAEVDGGMRSGGVSLLLDFALILVVLFRNRQQSPRRQSMLAFTALSLCIVLGSVIGCYERLHHPAV